MADEQGFGSRLDYAVLDLERRMKLVEEGVSNFRLFQKQASEFFTDHAAREEEKAKVDRHRARIHFALLGALLTLVTGCAIALFSWVLSGHHVVSDSRTSESIVGPQDAGSPIGPHY